MNAYVTTLHDKHGGLLAKIVKLSSVAPKTDVVSKKLATALMAVVARHISVKASGGKSGLNKRCTECGFAYPCPTIQDIEKRLTHD